VISFRGTYIRENSSLLSTFNAGGADFVQHHLNTVQANAEYHFGDKYSATIGWFDVNGTPDFTLYSGASTVDSVTTFPAVTGSANGDPRSGGYIANVSWWPVQNIGLSFQYTGYTRFNGGSVNYDGNGRSASSNNTVYLVARFVF
ncbi:MAG TPA: hypothetical protein VGH00_08535, partial [Chthoniobacterales bacterium]